MSIDENGRKSYFEKCTSKDFEWNNCNTRTFKEFERKGHWKNFCNSPGAGIQCEPATYPGSASEAGKSDDHRKPGEMGIHANRGGTRLAAPSSRSRYSSRRPLASPCRSDSIQPTPYHWHRDHTTTEKRCRGAKKPLRRYRSPKGKVMSTKLRSWYKGQSKGRTPPLRDTTPREWYKQVAIEQNFRFILFN